MALTGNVYGAQPVAKFWVNFNGEGTVAIRDSFNVTSITDNGTGDYTINFTVAFASANYSVGGVAGKDNDASGLYGIVPNRTMVAASFRFALIYRTDTLTDRNQVLVQGFGDQ